MKFPRRVFLHLAAVTAALPTISRFAYAQSYPTRPVRWIVGYPPGGGADTVTRILGQWLSERLGQQVVIENRPGASTNISAQAVINSHVAELIAHAKANARGGDWSDVQVAAVLRR